MRRRFCLLPLCGAALLLAGCGPSLSVVKGVVKLDGNPVEGATVTFATEDGQQTYSGFTDAGGNFTITQGEDKGIPHGNYKVLAIKTPIKAGTENLTVDSPDYMKAMAKEAKANIGAKAAIPMAPRPSAAAAAPKSDLPAMYANWSTTTLTAKVPSDGPIVLELTGGGKTKK